MLESEEVLEGAPHLVAHPPDRIGARRAELDATIVVAAAAARRPPVVVIGEGHAAHLAEELGDAGEIVALEAAGHAGAELLPAHRQGLAVEQAGPRAAPPGPRRRRGEPCPTGSPRASHTSKP